jgi:hypothetical protein
MRRRIHACHMRRRIHAIGSVSIISSNEEEDTCMSYEEEDTCHLKRMHHLEVDWLHLLPPPLLREGAP